MANIKTRYAAVTKAAKATSAQAAERLSGQPDAHDEERVFRIFRERAREDFRTLSPSSKVSRR